MTNISYESICRYMSEAGFEMVEANGGYYYCVQKSENKSPCVVWMDSACEDAYNKESATLVAWDVITDSKQIEFAVCVTDISKEYKVSAFYSPGDYSWDVGINRENEFVCSDLETAMKQFDEFSEYRDYHEMFWIMFDIKAFFAL